MIEKHWKRIAGLHVQDDGEIACVWMARDPDSDVIMLYDAAVFRREVMAVIAEGLNARGRWIPVAWQNKEVQERLLDRGCNMLPEESEDSEPIAEMVSRDIWERIRSGRFKVDKRLKEWEAEYKSFNRADAKVPRGSHPLMAATRHAMEQIRYAKRQAPKGKKVGNFPQVAMV